MKSSTNTIVTYQVYCDGEERPSASFARPRDAHKLMLEIKTGKVPGVRSATLLRSVSDMNYRTQSTTLVSTVIRAETYSEMVDRLEQTVPWSD
jgi:hypothetical protein